MNGKYEILYFFIFVCFFIYVFRYQKKNSLKAWRLLLIYDIQNHRLLYIGKIIVTNIFNQLYHAILTNQTQFMLLHKIVMERHWSRNDGEFYHGTFETLFAFIRKLRKIKENYNHIILFTLSFRLYTFSKKNISSKERDEGKLLETYLLNHPKFGIFLCS